MKLDGKYRILHSAQGLLCSVAFGYKAFYLGEFGYDAGEMGVSMAVFGVLTAICLPVFGRIADRSRFFNWKTMLTIFTLLGILDWGLLLFCDSKTVAGNLFQVGGLLTSCALPMVNVACFYYEKKGISVNYGIARGLNSLVYAISAYVLGRLTVRMGTSAVVLVGFLVNIAVLPTTLLMPYHGSTHLEKAEDKKIPAAEKKSREKFWKKYPAFMVMVIGSVLLMAVFNLTTIFLIQVIESVGGDSSHLGVALAIAALVEVPVLMLFDRIVKRVSESKLLVISGAAYVLKCLVLFCAVNITMIYAAQFLQMCSYALYASASVYFSDKCMEEEDAATGQTLISMCGSVGTVLGSLVGGYLVELLGVKVMLASAMVGSAVSALVFGLSMIMFKKEQKKKQGGYC